MKKLYLEYAKSLKGQIDKIDWDALAILSSELRRTWLDGRRVFICGNGGSAANALHIANDFLYGINPEQGGLKVEALSANTSVMTCLANDLGFDDIYAYQLEVKAQQGDILICLSGSGNSANIVNAITTAKKLNLKTFSILGFDGGRAKVLSDHVIHFRINDMQISEDLQIIVGHMLMKDLSQSQLQRVENTSSKEC